MRSQENAQKPQIWPVLQSQNATKNEENQKKVAWSVRKVVGIHQHAKFQVIPPMLLSGKCPETPKLTCFNKSKCRENKENQQTVIIIYWILKMVRLHQHAIFQTIPPVRSPENAPPNLTRFIKCLACVTLKFDRWPWKFGSHKR